ncbi:phage terminase small subunit P27 family, partial [Mycobacterium tuberculosis]
MPSPATARPDTATVGERVRAQVLWGVFWHHGIRDPKPGKRRVVLKMGRRGPAPAPAQLKLLGGRSPGRDSGGRRVTPPAAFERVAPECPDWLPPGAKDMWGRVVPELAALNLLKESDLGVLTSFCVAWDQLMQAVTAYREQGFIATNARSRRVTVHPAVAAARAATRDVLVLARE